MIQQRSGKYSFPGGTAEPGESAQCTAHRETWEEASVEVQVSTVKATFDNGFVLFNCDVRDGEFQTNNSLEVSDVIWVAPGGIPEQKWRFPEQKQLAIQWLNDKK